MSDDIPRRRVSDFGQVMLVDNEMWLGPPDTESVPRRLMEAAGRRETTIGGMAEAGWHFVGVAHWLAPDGSRL
jgi:hypothetical protein